MPELPEVETTRRGLAPHVLKRRVSAVLVRESRLRWPVPEGLSGRLAGSVVSGLSRRGKYLLFTIGDGTLIVHLGMSGSLMMVPFDRPVLPHDHVDVVLDNGTALRLNDPRRFGSIHWTQDDPLNHRLLCDLGPEPWARAFSAAALHRRAKGRRLAIKPFIMDSHTVVGVGNIYASEALFRAGIHPELAAGRIGLVRYRRLVQCIREVLTAAVQAGGTTLRDFVGGDGKPGYFQQTLAVYGRDGQACTRCDGTVTQVRQGQRASYFCPGCQH